MKRSAMTRAKRVRIFDANEGVCYLCDHKIKVGETWHVEHPIALELGGSDKEADLRPAHVDCHKPKTREDRRKIAKTHRIRANHIGARQSRNPLPGGKRSGWKRKMNGTWERRT